MCPGTLLCTHAYLCTHCMQRTDTTCMWRSYVYLCRLFLGLPSGLKASWGYSGITGSFSISHYHFSSCGFSAHPWAPHSAGLMVPTLPVSLHSWRSKAPLGTVRLIGNRTLTYRSWSALPRDPTLNAGQDIMTLIWAGKPRKAEGHKKEYFNALVAAI